MTRRPKTVGPEKRPGRKPEVLKIEGDWEDAVADAIKRGKPPAEPPKPKAKKKTKKR